MLYLLWYSSWQFCYRSNSTTPQLMLLVPGHRCLVCSTSKIQAMKSFRCTSQVECSAAFSSGMFCSVDSALWRQNLQLCTADLWNCWNCCNWTFQIEKEGKKVGILKRHTAFSTRFEKSFCLGGRRITALRYPNRIYHVLYNICW